MCALVAGGGYAEFAVVPQGQLLHWPLTVERLVGLGRLPHLAPMSRIRAEDAAAIERAMAAFGPGVELRRWRKGDSGRPVGDNSAPSARPRAPFWTPS